jgi:putative addiction module component (TIGR02574 family)
MTPNIDNILQLPVDERIEIMERIWDSIDDDFPDEKDEINIVRERFEEYKKNPGSVLDWNEVREKLFLKYGLDG